VYILRNLKWEAGLMLLIVEESMFGVGGGEGEDV